MLQRKLYEAREKAPEKSAKKIPPLCDLPIPSLSDAPFSKIEMSARQISEPDGHYTPISIEDRNEMGEKKTPLMTSGSLFCLLTVNCCDAYERRSCKIDRACPAGKIC